MRIIIAKCGDLFVLQILQRKNVPREIPKRTCLYCRTRVHSTNQPTCLLIGYNRSWDSTTPVGYRITTVNVNDPSSYEVFIDGWLTKPNLPGDSPNAWGRPADVLVMPDGSLLISDDKVMNSVGNFFKSIY